MPKIGIKNQNMMCFHHQEYSYWKLYYLTSIKTSHKNHNFYDLLENEEKSVEEL